MTLVSDKKPKLNDVHGVNESHGIYHMFIINFLGNPPVVYI